MDLNHSRLSRSMITGKKDNSEEVCRRRAAIEKELKQRREAAILAQKEKLARAETLKRELLEKHKESQQREKLRAQAAHERRAVMAVEKERRSFLSVSKTEQSAANTPVPGQKTKSVFAFGSRTPRELGYLVSLKKEQASKDRHTSLGANALNSASVGGLHVAPRGLAAATPLTRSMFAIKHETRNVRTPAPVMTQSMTVSGTGSKQKYATPSSSSRTPSSRLFSGSSYMKVNGHQKPPAAPPSKTRTPFPAKVVAPRHVKGAAPPAAMEAKMPVPQEQNRMGLTEVAHAKEAKGPGVVDLRIHYASRTQDGLPLKSMNVPVVTTVEMNQKETFINVVVEPDEPGAAARSAVPPEETKKLTNGDDVGDGHGSSSDGGNVLDRTADSTLTGHGSGSGGGNDSDISTDSTLTGHGSASGGGNVFDITTDSTLTGHSSASDNGNALDVTADSVLATSDDTNNGNSTQHEEEAVGSNGVKDIGAGSVIVTDSPKVEVVQQTSVKEHPSEVRARIAAIMSRTRAFPSTAVNSQVGVGEEATSGAVATTMNGSERFDVAQQSAAAASPRVISRNSVLHKLVTTNPRLMQALRRNGSNPSLADELTEADPSMSLPGQVEDTVGGGGAPNPSASVSHNGNLTYPVTQN